MIFNEKGDNKLAACLIVVARVPPVITQNAIEMRVSGKNV